MKAFLFALLFFPLAFAGDCDPMNLVTEPNSPFNDIPVMDQDGSNTCYAFAAAQLLDYKLSKMANHPIKVNPAWLALNRTNHRVDGAFYASSVLAAVQGLSAEGNCPENYIRASMGQWGKRMHASEPQIMGLLDRISGHMIEPHQGQRSEAELEQLFIKSGSEAACNAAPFWHDFSPLLLAMKKINSETILRELILPLCKKLKTPVTVPGYISRLASVYRMETPVELNRLLDRSHAPVSIGMCGHALYDPQYQGLLPPTPTNQTPVKRDCQGHSALLVGKRKVEGQCQFLLRNSWGSGFGGHNSHFQCLCRNRETGAFVDNCTAKTHNNGQYTVDSCWVPASILPLNVTDYFAFR